VDDEQRESLKLKIRMAKEMLASLPAELPRREIVVGAMEGVIADAERDLAGTQLRGADEELNADT